MSINDLARKMADDYYRPNCSPNNDGRWLEHVNKYEKGIRRGLEMAILICDLREKELLNSFGSARAQVAMEADDIFRSGEAQACSHLACKLRDILKEEK